jgi:hypothetical protein
MSRVHTIALLSGAVCVAIAAASKPAAGLEPARDAGAFHVIDAKHPVRIPSYSRQTKLPCNVCHTLFPQLTSFGRLFKMNGYTLSGIDAVTARDEGNRQTLNLDLIPPLSVMFISSATRTSKAQPGAANGGLQFPDELSLFVGEAITPRLGTFLQFTYAAVDGSLAIDNAELRYANHTSLSGKPLTFGMTLNNNPTMQDVWNSTPVWGFPYVSSPIAPTPAAATLVDGGLGQSVAGLGGYAFFDNALYAEFSAYRSAPQGGTQPADSTAENTIGGIAPYWRVALTHAWGHNTVEVGTLGMNTRLIPEGIEGVTDGYRDLAADFQYERSMGTSVLTVHGIFVHEKQTLNALFSGGSSENATNTLRTFRADGSIIMRGRSSVSAGIFGTSGSTDAGLYSPDPVEGSGTGSPDSRGFIAQVDFMPWLNTRVGLQEVVYTRFNGAGSAYDGFGRDASSNNTTFLSVWLAF